MIYKAYYRNNKSNTMVMGYVCSSDGNPLKHAVVIVQKYNYRSCTYEEIGYLISDDNGKFCLNIEDINSYYKLIVYDSRLNSEECKKI